MAWKSPYKTKEEHDAAIKRILEEARAPSFPLKDGEQVKIVTITEMLDKEVDDVSEFDNGI